MLATPPTILIDIEGVRIHAHFKMDAIAFSIGVALVAILSFMRLSYLISQCGKVSQTRKRLESCKTVVVVGAGGHSSEMMKLLAGLQLEKYTPRIYIVAQSDQISRKKIQEFEKAGQLTIWSIMRAREVGQSYLTSIFTTLWAFFHSLSLLFIGRPDLLLCNGPGTCVPVCFAAYLIKFLGFKDIRIVYVESFCRVENLSLSGRILYRLYIASDVIVQWPQLTNKYERTRYLGKLI